LEFENSTVNDNSRRESRKRTEQFSYGSEDDDTWAASRITSATLVEENVFVATAFVPVTAAAVSKQPLPAVFAKRCYLTKAGIGIYTQPNEALTLTGNVVPMLAAVMKLQGCPTICDDDLRREG
jgi:hypothetical protein